jgi:SAM-dependent methyltransferase
MGLDINGAQFMLAAREHGAGFDETLMLGRQSLNVYPQRLAQLLRKHGLPDETFRAAGPECAFAEPFFKALGAKQVSALDFSGFEGAQFIHDLNQPLPASLKERFDVVYDGGTLEHVFNFPVALRNSMELLREGGRLFIHTAANNLCGHGFYQFSPELFYRTFSPENGFIVERMVIHRVGPYGNWYEVSDPNAIRARVELITFTPMHLLVQARRTAIKEIFAQTPLQSDYVELWHKPETGEAAPVKNPRFVALARWLHVIKTGLEFYRRQSLGNRKCFRKTRREG